MQRRIFAQRAKIQRSSLPLYHILLSLLTPSPHILVSECEASYPTRALVVVQKRASLLPLDGRPLSDKRTAHWVRLPAITRALPSGPPSAWVWQPRQVLAPVAIVMVPRHQPRHFPPSSRHPNLDLSKSRALRLSPVDLELLILDEGVWSCRT